MNCVAIIFLAYLAINSGSSSDLSGSSNFPSRENCTAEELRTCPMNSSITVKVYRNLRGEWLTTFVNGNELRNFTRSFDLDLEKNVVECGDSRYVKISGFLKDTKVNAIATDNRISIDEDNDSCKLINECTTLVEDSAYEIHRIVELTTIAEDIASQTTKAQQIMEQRMNSFEKTQNNITETLSSFEKTQTSFQKTLTNIEQVLNELRGILNSTKNLDTEDKENPTTKPPQLINNAEAQMTFDHVNKGWNVGLSSDYRTASRMEPLEEYGTYGGVISNYLLTEDEVFQIRIEETITEWSNQGIAIGVIKEKKDVENQESIYDDIKGTWAINSHETVFGKSDTYRDGYKINEYPLDTRSLPVGTLLGVSRSSDGNLHFFLNGIDKGPAFQNVPKDVYAFVDIIKYVTKISIIS